MTHFVTEADQVIPLNTKIRVTFTQCLTNVGDVGPTLYTSYTNVLCLLGARSLTSRGCDYKSGSKFSDTGPAMVHRWSSLSLEEID